MDTTGAYTADRASALSGVPKSTIHWWARNDVLEPSVSVSKVKLWSYADLMGLRVIYWLRQQKTTAHGVDIPATSMGAVKQALAELRALEIPLWQADRPSVVVNGRGRVYLQAHLKAGGLQTTAGQLAHETLIDLVAPFSTREGLKGPDLLRPRPELRIVPGKLSGSPHVAHTRVETCALAALAADGLSTARIVALYAYLTKKQIAEAVALEKQLTENLAYSAAA
jgi:uncharacterized protein (DUF433 family)